MRTHTCFPVTAGSPRVPSVGWTRIRPGYQAALGNVRKGMPGASSLGVKKKETRKRGRHWGQGAADECE